MGDNMTVSTVQRNPGGHTLGERFSSYLASANGSSDIALLVRSFGLSLRATNKSPKTIKS